MENEVLSEIKDYTKDIEDLFIQFLISDPELFVRCKGITNDKYFNDDTNRAVIRFLDEHSTAHSSLPTIAQIRAVTGKKGLEKLDDINESHSDWFLAEYETFIRHKAIESVILSSVDLIKDHRYGEVEKAVKEAVQIGLVKNLGTDYFYDPVTRLEAIRNNNGMITTGWRDVDNKLYGGLNRGEICIFAGQSGSGKSLFLQNMGVNWAQAGLNVVYITLELSENLTGMRIDAMISGIETRGVLKDIEGVAMKVKNFYRKYKGDLRLKQMPNGCTANDIRAYIKELEVQTGKRIDAVLVDYLDLMMPVSTRISPSDQFIKDKFVSEELRNMAVELNILCVTASQLNRGSYEEVEFDPSHIAGGISKINTADNVIGIFTSQAMRDSGRYQIQFMKTRSSAGVGSRVDLAFSPTTLRISDLEEGQDDAVTSSTKNVMSQLRQTNTVTNPPKQQSSSGSPAMTDKRTKDNSDKGQGVGQRTTQLRNLLKDMDN
jgi:replicative DNA helicase